MLKPSIWIALGLCLAGACEGRRESRATSPMVPPGAPAATSPSDGGAPTALLPPPAGPAPAPGPVDAGITTSDAGADAAPPAPGEPELARTDAGSDLGLASQNGEMRCGEPPYQVIKLNARDIMDPDKRSEIPGVTVTFKHCPERTFALKRNAVSVPVTAGAETWIRFDAPGYLPWVEGELRVPSDKPPQLEATMVPLAFVQSVVPAWQPDVPLVYVDVRMGRTGAVDACRSAAGVTLAVKDHPQALVLYRGKGANPDYLNAAGTSEEGVAVIANLPKQASVELLASKPGCLYQAALGDANSEDLLPLVRAPLFPGALTHQIVNPIR